MKEQVEEQLRRYETYLRQDPENVKLLTETAYLYSQLGHFVQALATLEKAEKHAPADPAIAFAKSSIFLAFNQPKLAVKELTKLLARGVDNSAIRYNLGYAHALLRQMNEAEAVLMPADAIINKLPEAAILLARVKHHLGDLEGSISLLDNFIRTHTDHPRRNEAEGILALAALDNEDRDTAKNYAKQAADENSGNAEAQITLGSLALEEFDVNLASQCFQNVLDRTPSSGRAWLGKGLVEMLKRNLDAAEDALAQAAKHMPSHLGTWNTLAWCQIAAAKIDEAEQTLQHAMEADRNFSETHGGLAIIAILQDQIDIAQEHVKRALRLNPQSFSGKFAQSLMENAAGNSEKAQELIRNLMQTPIGKDQRTLDKVLQDLAKQHAGTTH